MKAWSLLAVLGLSSLAWADGGGGPPHMFAIEAGNLAYEAWVSGGSQVPVQVSYEAGIADHVSLFGEPGAVYHANFPMRFGLVFGANVYPFSNALSGFFFGLQGNVIDGAATLSNATVTFVFEPGANVGFNLVLGGLILGPGVNVVMTGLGTNKLDFEFAPRFNIGIGF